MQTYVYLAECRIVKLEEGRVVLFCYSDGAAYATSLVMNVVIEPLPPVALMVGIVLFISVPVMMMMEDCWFSCVVLMVKLLGFHISELLVNSVALMFLACVNR